MAHPRQDEETHEVSPLAPAISEDSWVTRREEAHGEAGQAHSQVPVLLSSLAAPWGSNRVK